MSPMILTFEALSLDSSGTGAEAVALRRSIFNTLLRAPQPIIAFTGTAVPRTTKSVQID